MASKSKKGRAKSLDNIIKFKKELPREKADLLDITVIVIISKDLDSLLPEEMIKHYQSLGIKFNFVPLYPLGKAKSFSHLCPDLDSDNPEDLGAYGRYHKKGSRKKSDENNNRLRTDHIILIGDDYYFSDPWHKVGRLGHLPDEIIGAYAGEP